MDAHTQVESLIFLSSSTISCFRIGFLLQHDHPLPKYLLTTSSNGRYHPVQSRKAASKVYEVIKSWADFCLLENSSYVKFIRQVNSTNTDFLDINL